MSESRGGVPVAVPCCYLTNCLERHPESAGCSQPQGARLTDAHLFTTIPLLSSSGFLLSSILGFLPELFHPLPPFFPEAPSSSHRIIKSQPILTSCDLKIHP